MQVEQNQTPSRPHLKERWVDLDWIIHNLLVFAPASAAGHREFGRGALIVAISNKHENEGPPFSYFPQKEISLHEDESVKAMVAAYDPLNELVIILLKAKQQVRSYRVRTVPDLY